MITELRLKTSLLMKSLRDEAEKELTDQMQLRGGSTIGRRELPPDRRG
jgi:hypothetical protein